MTNDNTTHSSAPAASKRKKSTPEQRIARLEQQLARAKADQRKTSRKLQTRGKIIVGAACLRLIDSLAADRQQSFLGRLWALISERDRQALLDSGLLPEQAIPGDSTDGVKIHPSGSDTKKSGNCA